MNNELIGFINDVEINNDEIELGFVINPKYKNNGYATEVLSEVIDVLFSIGYKIIKTEVFKENIASIKVMENCKMNRLNVLNKIEYRNNIYECICFEIKNLL